MIRVFPNLEEEKKLWNSGYLVIGIDEVGRGALAGPVGVGAVCFHPNKNLSYLERLGINDSKLLSHKSRLKIKESMSQYILSSSVSISHVSMINSKGIVYAVNNAIRRSISEIRQKLQTTLPFYLLLDAFHVKYINGIGLNNQTAIIKGDQVSISIAAASILAKIQRDQLMSDLSRKYESYQWEKNKGYGTKDHLNALKLYGASQLHRTLYIRKALHSQNIENN